MNAASTVFDTSARQQPLEIPAPSTVACLRCRHQKLKCDRELPSCERCSKQKVACTYPLPPDRKRIAQRTNRARPTQPPAIEELVDHSASLSPGPIHAAKRSRLVEETPCKKHPCDRPRSAELPPTEVGLLLLEVYFKRVYNATLLFHKNIAFQLYMQNAIPGYLLRAIFAHAAIFLKEVEESPHRKHIKTLPMQSLYSQSWMWARSASVEALSLADEPSLVRIQALHVLELYYFAQGESDRATVHGSLAYRLSQLLGYDRLYEDATSCGIQFDREIKRRSFWAGWCSLIIGSTQLDASRVFERVCDLPLPARFASGGSIQRVELVQGEKMDRDWKTLEECPANHRRTVSLMAELIKLLGIWLVPHVLILL
jgi:hypothetical protein